MYLRAEEDPRWTAFRFSSLENPHLSRLALDELTEDMLDIDYAQEIEAEFVKGAGQLFTLNYDDFLPEADIDVILKGHKGHRIVGGLDWGKIDDCTALSTGCAICSKELQLVRFPEISYPIQLERIKGVYDLYKLGGFDMEILAESNAMGLPNIEQMREDGVPLRDIATSSSSKPQMVQALRLCFQQRAWRWVENKIGTQELESYEARVTQHGNLAYSAPEGLHDDTVLARMLMYWQALTGTFTLV